jgi:hypothetical protein
VRRFFYENKKLIMPPPIYLRALAEIPPIHKHLGDSELRELHFGVVSARARVRNNPSVELLSFMGSKAQQKKNRAMKRALARDLRKHDSSKK